MSTTNVHDIATCTSTVSGSYKITALSRARMEHPAWPTTANATDRYSRAVVENAPAVVVAKHRRAAARAHHELTKRVQIEMRCLPQAARRGRCNRARRPVRRARRVVRRVGGGTTTSSGDGSGSDGESGAPRWSKAGAA